MCSRSRATSICPSSDPRSVSPARAWAESCPKRTIRPRAMPSTTWPASSTRPEASRPTGARRTASAASIRVTPVRDAARRLRAVPRGDGPLLQAELSQPLEERGIGDAEGLGRGHPSPFAKLENARDVGALRGLEGRRDVAGTGGEAEERVVGRGGVRGDAALRQDDVALGHLLAARQDDRALDDVAQLAHVARIIIRGERLERPGSEAGEALLDAAGEETHEGERQAGDVLQAGGQRRDGGPEDPAGGVQVRPQTP